MKGGAPALVMEFDTAPVFFDQSVSVILTNTGQDETFALVTLTPTLGNFGGPVQEVSVDLPPGESTETILSSIDSRGGNACWLSIVLQSDQVVPTAIFFNGGISGFTEVARYLPGDFAIFNLLGGRTRLG